MSLAITDEPSLVVPENMYQILTPEGKVVGQVPDLSREQMRQLYRWMVFGRTASDRMVALQRQGRMGTFSPINGQEAASVGMTFPLKEKDWLLGSYREFLCYIIKGVPFTAQLKRWIGRIVDDYPSEARCVPFQIVLGTQMLHAVGIAQAIKYERKPHVALVGCGDGATSEGDFNEALNFAGVFKAPVIFVVQNNGWAISTPRHQQSAARQIADRGLGFGVPSCVVDGNDVLAVYQTVSEAIDRARAGAGPTLIEAITYRMGPHTTADDPTKYRPQEEVERWAKRDPLVRFRTYLMDQNMLTEAEDKQLHEEVDTEFEANIAALEALSPPDPRQQFQHVYAEPTAQLRQQEAHIMEELGLDE